ncbi:MAG: RNA polymerase sigma factor [Lentisphaeria bacterium]|nr:RNA polymerase sigma factor [Lentisphaeria bacterium]
MEENIKNSAEESSDEALFSAALDGSQTAIQTIFERYRGSLTTYASRFLKSADLAQDVVQDTFLKFLDNPPSRLQDGSLAPWFFRVARNLALDRFRHGRFEIATEGVTDLATEDNADDATNPLSQMMAANDAECLRRICGELPDEFRVVVEDRIDRNLSFQEIAEREAIPLGTALWRVHRAFEIIRRKWLAEE